MKPELCKNCSTPLAGKYCYHCGQKEFQESEKTMGHLIHDVFHFITHLEGNIFRTFKTIFLKPGKLSLDYTNGIQKRYFKPISLFLIIVVTYLIFPFISGMNMELKSHKSMVIYGNVAKKQIEAKIASNKLSEADLTEKYTIKSQKTSKILLLLLIPLSALCIYVLHLRSNKMAYDYLILATEINAFYLASSYLLLPLLVLPVVALLPNRTFFNDLIYSSFSSLIFFIVLIVTFKTFFKEGIILSTLKSIVFVFLHLIFAQLIYRFILFEVTLALV